MKYPLLCLLLLRKAQAPVPDEMQLLENVRILSAGLLEERLSGTAGSRKALADKEMLK